MWHLELERAESKTVTIWKFGEWLREWCGGINGAARPRFPFKSSYFPAIKEISTNAAFGKPLTSTVALAGGFSLKDSP